MMDCAFCTEFAVGTDTSGGDDGRVVAETDGWVLLPTVGCFTPGYCLFMPIDHIDAVADVGPAGLAEVEQWLEDMRGLVSAVFGPTIVAEHGPRGCQLGAGCCSHAHLHLIPVPDPDQVTAAYRGAGGAGQQLDRLADLPNVVDGPYLYLSPTPGIHLHWPSGQFARQYVRRVCANLHGLGKYFDWRDHPYDANQALTIHALRSALQAKAAQ